MLEEGEQDWIQMHHWIKRRS